MVVKAGLPDPTTETATKYSWFAFLSSGLAAVTKAAAATTPERLDSLGQTARWQTTIKLAVQQELAEQGLICCDVCTMPVLDPTDPQYPSKARMIASIGRRGVRVVKCTCGVDHVPD